MPFIQHYILDPLLGALVAILQIIFWILPFRVSSAIGGGLARLIGPNLAISRKAQKNLQYVWPDMPPERQQEIITRMWDNLGRNFAEYPGLGRLQFGNMIHVHGAEAVNSIIGKRPIVFAAAHIGNWETIPYFWAKQGWKVDIVYRRANNRYVDWVIQFIRSRTGLTFAAKGREASKQIIQSLSKSSSVALLMDQRMSDGEEIDFLGKPAMTGTGWIKLVLRNNAAIVPVYCVRGRDHDPCKFDMIYDTPILPEQLNLPADSAEAVRFVAAVVNKKYGEWISAGRGADQWLWLHRRWGRLV